MTIPKAAFSQSADTTEEIVQAIIASMDSDNNVCELFITDEELIDANKWLSLINGIEQLRCEYRRIKNGFNVRITYECWDNFAIIKAYRSESTYNLNERQLVLYDKYTKILEEIISPNQSDIEKEIAIHDYLVDNINYVDTGDSSYNAYSALINGIAVCSGYTECFKTLLDMLGIENATISGEAGGQQHIWNVVNLDNHWYHVDVTWDDPVGSSSDYIDHSYFNISADDMALDHTWDRSRYSAYEKCGAKYSYCRYKKLPLISNVNQLNKLIYSTVKNKTAHIEFTTTYNADLKEAISRTGQQLSYSYIDIQQLIVIFLYVNLKTLSRTGFCYIYVIQLIMQILKRQYQEPDSSYPILIRILIVLITRYILLHLHIN